MWKKYSPNRLYSNFVKENQKQQLKETRKIPTSSDSGKLSSDYAKLQMWSAIFLLYYLFLI